MKYANLQDGFTDAKTEISASLTESIGVRLWRTVNIDVRKKINTVVQKLPIQIRWNLHSGRIVFNAK